MQEHGFKLTTCYSHNPGCWCHLVKSDNVQIWIFVLYLAQMPKRKFSEIEMHTIFIVRKL